MGFKEGLYVTLSRGSIPSFFRFFFGLKFLLRLFSNIYIVTLAMISEVEI